MRKSFKERFEEKFIPVPESGCWLWDGWLDKKGYGYVNHGGKPIKAHRAAMIIEHGEIPKGMHVLHKCDIKSCVNPRHLYFGTNADNMRDKAERGKACRGENRPTSRLKENEIRHIRQKRVNGAKTTELAKEYGVHASHISRICSKEKWRHVQEY